jgi:hypothetical protein
LVGVEVEDVDLLLVLRPCAGNEEKHRKEKQDDSHAFSGKCLVGPRGFDPRGPEAYLASFMFFRAM